MGLLLGIDDHLDLELGGWLGPATSDEIHFAMGHAGARYSFADERGATFLTLSGGLAAGRGAYRRGVLVRRLTLGSYVGADIGARVHDFFAFYLGNRLQLSWARGVPATGWGLHVMGIRFVVANHLLLGLEGGRAWFANSRDNLSGWTGSLQMGGRY